MTTTHRDRLRKIMTTAWGLFRADRNSAEPRSFADALAGAWRWVRKMEGWTPPAWATQPGHVRFGSLVQSPIRRALTGQRYAGHRGYMREYATASFGR